METFASIAGGFGALFVCVLIGIFLLHLMPSRRWIAYLITALVPLMVLFVLIAQIYAERGWDTIGLEMLALPVLGLPLLALGILSAVLAARIVKRG